MTIWFEWYSFLYVSTDFFLKEAGTYDRPLLLHSVRVMLQHQPLNLPRTALRHRILAAAHPETPPFVRLTAADALTGRPNLQPVPGTMPPAH